MAAMSTALTEFADNGNSRTYTLSGHTVLDPRIVVQKRHVPSGKQVIAEVTVTLTYGVRDADGVQLPQRLSTTITNKVPIHMDDTGGLRAAQLAVIRDIVASDEFAASLSSQNWLK